MNPMNLTECLVCGVTLWQTADNLCWQHNRWRLGWRHTPLLRLQRLIGENEKSDFFYRDWNYRALQTMRLTDAEQPTSWRVIVGDINRYARHWLDDDTNNGESNEGRVA